MSTSNGTSSRHANGRVSEDGSGVRARLLKQNTQDAAAAAGVTEATDTDDLVISFEVPQHIPPPSGRGGGYGSHMASDAPATGVGGRDRRPSTSSMRCNSWKLKYQDFFPPKPTANSLSADSRTSWENTTEFQDLVSTANEWLRKNPGLQPKTCETVTWMSHDPKNLGSGDLMVISKNLNDNTLTYFLNGLRVWFVPGNSKAYTSISCTDFCPNEDDNTIVKLIAKVNRKIEQRQIKGEILNVETVSTPVLGADLDSQVTRWTETMDNDNPYAFVLRVFSVRDSGSRSQPNAQLGVKDVVPRQTSEDMYEGFEDLIERANVWLRSEQSEVSIVNMQSILAQKDAESRSETGNACFYSSPGINSPTPVDLFRLLRIVYCRRNTDQLGNDVTHPVSYPFLYETFTPEMVRKESKDSTCPKERLEKMNETFSKVIAFLCNSDVEVICAEMVSNPMQMYTTEGDYVPNNEIRFLYTIRLYLSGQIHRLQDSLRSIKRASLATSARSCSPAPDEASTHPGPIFLKSVVSRKFPYRWIILAATAISCMSVIVVVSVVYSNR